MIEPRHLRVVGDLAPDIVSAHASATRLETLEDVLHAGWDVRAIIVQDEYTHDVIVDGKHDAFLVFDTT